MQVQLKELNLNLNAAKGGISPDILFNSSNAINFPFYLNIIMKKKDITKKYVLRRSLNSEQF